MKKYGRLDENLQGTFQKNRVFCAVMPIHDQRISRRTEIRRLFELTKLKKAPSFVIVGLFSADHYLVPCLSLLSSECVVFTDVPRDFRRLAEYFLDGWRKERLRVRSYLSKVGAGVRTIFQHLHAVSVKSDSGHSLCGNSVVSKPFRPHFHKIHKRNVIILHCRLLHVFLQ